jgi:8-oxo-dGTP diphosphatase
VKETTGLLIVVAAALTDDEGRVLMQRRPAGKMHGGLWEFPGGKIESGESPEAALVRELAEELAIVVEPGDLTPRAFATAPAGERILLLLYNCSRWQGEVQAIEADALIWRRPADLLDLPMPPADLPLVAALRARER